MSRFNLIDEPWIRARTLAGELVELSIRDVLLRAQDLQRLANDLPTQDFAILRLLEAILTRALEPRIAEAADEDLAPADVWEELWQASTLPAEEIETYLAGWHDSFWLFDDERPFMQEADLRPGNGKPLEIKKIVADVPDGTPFFTMRTGAALESLTYAEAARWLVHTQAYDTSGIKTGVIGDPNVKGGKSYPIGTGWAGQLGGVFVEGDNLRQTLLLNLILGALHDLAGDFVAADDLPEWELAQPGGCVRPHDPRGPVDLYTWQSRRIRLIPDGDVVREVVLTNATKLDVYDRQHCEPMASWRRNTAAEKRLHREPVYTPVRPQAGRAMWRGLDAILGTGGRDAGAGEIQQPGVLAWIGYLAGPNGGRKIPMTYTLRLHAIGMRYGTQDAVVEQVIDDRLALQAYLLTDEGASAAELARECMAETDQVVLGLGRMAANICIASGEDDDAAGPRDHARAEAYFDLDAPFRTWLADLGPQSDLVGARRAWVDEARHLIDGVALSLVEGAPPAAHVGHKVSSSSTKTALWMTASRAEAIFKAGMRKIWPLDRATTEGAAADGAVGGDAATAGTAANSGGAVDGALSSAMDGREAGTDAGDRDGRGEEE